MSQLKKATKRRQQKRSRSSSPARQQTKYDFNDWMYDSNKAIEKHILYAENVYEFWKQLNEFLNQSEVISGATFDEKISLLKNIYQACMNLDTTRIVSYNLFLKKATWFSYIQWYLLYSLNEEEEVFDFSDFFKSIAFNSDAQQRVTGQKYDGKVFNDMQFVFRSLSFEFDVNAVDRIDDLEMKNYFITHKNDMKECFNILQTILIDTMNSIYGIIPEFCKTLNTKIPDDIQINSTSFSKTIPYYELMDTDIRGWKSLLVHFNKLFDKLKSYKSSGHLDKNKITLINQQFQGKKYDKIRKNVYSYVGEPEFDYQGWIKEQNNYLLQLDSKDLITLFFYSFHGDEIANSYLRNTITKDGTTKWWWKLVQMFSAEIERYNRQRRTSRYKEDVGLFVLYVEMFDLLDSFKTINDLKPYTSPFVLQDVWGKIQNLSQHFNWLSMEAYDLVVLQCFGLLNERFYQECVQKFCERLQRIILQAPRIQQESVVYRGEKSLWYRREHFDQKQVEHAGFMSTTLSATKAEEFAVQIVNGVPTIKKIILPAGSPALLLMPMTKFVQELEVLLPTEATFEIKDLGTIWLNDTSNWSNKTFSFTKSFVCDAPLAKFRLIELKFVSVPEKI